jgi:hypothetical protein
VLKKDRFMGIKLFSSDSYPEENKYPEIIPMPKPGNPNPGNYKIIDTLTFGNILIAEIEYPDCKNYEGRKILVYEGITSKQLRAQKYIDPHFSKHGKYKSPIARFEPTERGWKMAESFAKMWTMKK